MIEWQDAAEGGLVGIDKHGCVWWVTESALGAWNVWYSTVRKTYWAAARETRDEAQIYAQAISSAMVTV